MQVLQSGSSRSAGRPTQGGADVTGVSHSVQSAGASVSVLRADITQLQVDVIVNTANERMDHMGGLAKFIVQKGTDVL